MRGMNRELAEKDRRLAEWCALHGYDGILLRTRANVAWVTGGADVCVDQGHPLGVASVLWTPTRKVLLTDTIEARRISEEEAPPGFDVSARDWFLPTDAPKGRIANDWPEDPIATLRASLTSSEVTRYRTLGIEVSSVVESVLKDARVGDSEVEVGGRLVGVLAMRGIRTPVLLAAADGRIAAYRHPLPTDQRIEKAFMLVVCAERGGLVVAMTRLVHFGSMPADLVARHEACCRVDARMRHATRPGKPLADIFATAQRAYADEGFDGEWCFHHQGGPIGYRTRDAIALPEGPGIVVRRQAFAWNPSITGTKSEDTMLSDGSAITTTTDWPVGDHGRPLWLVRAGRARVRR